LNDVLDQPKLIRLANAVGLSYPGMRTRSKKRARLVADLTDKAARDERRPARGPCVRSGRRPPTPSRSGRRSPSKIALTG
jgi:hypothetical protein